MLRIHFTDADLARTRVEQEPDPLWEVVMSLHRLQTRWGRRRVQDWYADVRRTLTERGLDTTVRSLLVPIAPFADYFPDFLTPDAARHGLDAGLEAVAATPRSEFDRQLEMVAERRAMPTGIRSLTEGDPRPRSELVTALRVYHDTALAPYWERIRTVSDADRIRRARDLLHGGVEGLLGGFAPLMRWEAPTLHVDYPLESDLYLGGRGIRFIPSYFCHKRPVALADQALPPVLVYPLHSGASPVGQGSPPSQSAPLSRALPLRALLGATRAEILQAVAMGMTTSELAAHLGITPAAASHHTRILRDAGLIVSTRDRHHVLHTITAAGSGLLETAAG
ncbi:ArsR family transcriptional regulator [Nocardiopsis gilva YIM 90087]|uniref:ArsR family transcriptional regulator n=1 Tax=Nocardiopsis gilva YIM 90087 TaxID=1235441 RepID=A0A223S0H2_9ACTN|nr:winged helix-turn-helix domain-containing protein [Nocardiopsis gilva]ASU81616.1 ArsR family transcriptional regulator [Nocardiopsis gilva YIM 90087]